MKRHLICLFTVLSISACAESTKSTSPNTPEPDMYVESLPDGCDSLTSPSEDDGEMVQTALIEAVEGSTVCLSEGTFSFRTEISLTVANVTIRGAGIDKTIFDFSAQDVGGNGILISADGTTVEDLRVLNPPGDGIRANEVNGISFRRVSVIWERDMDSNNGAYGLYPVGSENVLIDSCVVKGASDAGIYVGQSRTILVKDSEAYGNVAGIEIENSVDAEVVNNHAHDNTGGILVFNLPELPMKNGARTKVHKNIVENNNVVNFGKVGSVVGNVPGGVGLIILATDDNEVTENIFRNNGSSAIIVTSYLQDIFGLYEDDQFDGFPNGNYIHNNTYEGNGLMPQSIVAALELESPAPDILWDGCIPDMAGPINCIQENESVTFRGIDYCGGLQDQITDRGPFDCAYETLPNQNL
jgi:parallel beta-helix repeat protein